MQFPVGVPTWARSSAAEQLAYIQPCGGSSPSAPTNQRVAQSVAHLVWDQGVGGSNPPSLTNGDVVLTGTWHPCKVFDASSNLAVSTNGPVAKQADALVSEISPCENG